MDTEELKQIEEIMSKIRTAIRNSFLFGVLLGAAVTSAIIYVVQH